MKVNKLLIVVILLLVSLFLNMHLYKEIDKSYEKGYFYGWHESKFLDCTMPTNEIFKVIFDDERYEGSIRNNDIPLESVCNILEENQVVSIFSEFIKGTDLQSGSSLISDKSNLFYQFNIQNDSMMLYLEKLNSSLYSEDSNNNRIIVNEDIENCMYSPNGEWKICPPNYSRVPVKSDGESYSDNGKVRE